MSATPQRPAPSLTIGQLPPGFLTVRCADCDRREALDVAALRNKVGAELPVADLGRRFRCRECRGPANAIYWANFAAGHEPPAGTRRQSRRLWPGERLAQD